MTYSNPCCSDRGFTVCEVEGAVEGVAENLHYDMVVTCMLWTCTSRLPVRAKITCTTPTNNITGAIWNPMLFDERKRSVSMGKL